MPPPLPPGTWIPAAADASARSYFRGEWGGCPALLADFGEDLDSRERFLWTTALLRDGGVRVPEVLHAPAGESFIIEELVEGAPLSSIRWTEDLLRRVLDLAALVAAIPPWDRGPTVFSLDADRLGFELSFFRLHFLETFLNLQVPPDLPSALRQLAEAAAAPSVLCHRDFHSENLILSKGNELVLIDHQDALLGHASYDAASLAVEAYRPASTRRYEEIRARWLALKPGSSGDFSIVALQRTLKALGTFGFQVTRRKKPRFLGPMKVAARYALMLLHAGPPALAPLRNPLEMVIK